MVEFRTVKAGDDLYDPTPKDRWTGRRSHWPVHVISVHDTHAIVEWNNNPPTRYTPRMFTRLRRSPPKP